MELLVFRYLGEKEKNLEEALQRVQLLEKEITARDGEVTFFFSGHSPLYDFSGDNYVTILDQIVYFAHNMQKHMFVFFFNRYPNVKLISLS